MGADDLAVVVGHHVRAVSVQDAGLAGSQGSRVMPGGNALAARLDTVHGDFLERQKRMEHADSVGTTTDASNQRVRQAADLGTGLVNQLAADDGVEVAHQHRIRVWAGDGADHVEGVVNIGHPVAQRLVERVLERAGATGHRHDLGTQQLHAVDVGRLAFDVVHAHVDHALQAKTGGDGGRGDPVLASAGLGDDPGLAQMLGQQGLADGVVDLVRAGVVEVFSLEPDLRPTPGLGQPLAMVERAGPADVVGVVAVQLGAEGGVVLEPCVGLFELPQRLH